MAAWDEKGLTLKINAITQVGFLLGLVAASTSMKRSPPLKNAASSININQATVLYRALESALRNDSSVLYQLQRVFFPPDNHLNAAKVPFSVSIIVVAVTNVNRPQSDTLFNCSSQETNCSWSNILIDWYPELTASVYSDDLRQYVLSIYTKLGELEYVSWSLLQLLAEFGQNKEYPVVSVTLKVPTLEMLPNNEDARQALLAVMTWVKAYARGGSSDLIQRSDADKGDVFFATRESDLYLELCILLLFLSLNLFLTLMAGVFLKSFSSFLVRKATAVLKESTRMLSLYWATALVFTAANIVCFAADLFAFQTKLSDGYNDHNILYLKLFLIVFLLLTEPFIVYYTTRHFSVILNVPERVVQALCCCFSNVYGSRFAHTIAVLNILWFVHRIMTSLILVLFYIVVSPAETFTTVTLMFSVVIIAIFLTSFVLHTCSAPRKRISVRTACKVFCAVVTGILAMTVVVSFSLVYLMLLDNGLQTSGVGGFLLSLFPPFLFFIIGLIVQKKFLRNKKSDRAFKGGEPIVSVSTGNVTKLAEYQQSEVERDGGCMAKNGKKRSLSVQFSTDTEQKESVNSHRKCQAEDETSSLVKSQQ